VLSFRKVPLPLETLALEPLLPELLLPELLRLELLLLEPPLLAPLPTTTPIREMAVATTERAVAMVVAMAATARDALLLDPALHVHSSLNSLTLRRAPRRVSTSSSARCPAGCGLKFEEVVH
jgi:hypothetical protein